MRLPFRPLILAAACLLLGAPSQAEARQPYRAYFPPRPIYRGVYTYPQVVPTIPYTVSPYSYGYPYSAYSPGWAGGYSYYPGSYYYYARPFGSPSFGYTNPSYSYWYRYW